MDVPIGDIILDPRLQMRESMRFDIIDEYAEAVATLPNCKIVMGEGGKMWLTSGWHRYHAFKKAGKETVPCHVREGTFLDALVEACGENEGHGIRRSPEDKRRAISTLIETPEWADKSDKLIAKTCRVGEHLVADVRSVARARNTTGDGDKNGEQTKRTGSDGRTYNAKKPKEKSGQSARKPRKKPTESGKIIFDWKDYKDVLGKMVRMVDKLGDAYQCGRSPVAQELRDALGTWNTKFRTWAEFNSKQKAPQ